MKSVAIFTISLRGGGAERIISELLDAGKEQFKLHLILLDPEIVYQIPDHPNVQVHGLPLAPRSKILSVLFLVFSAWHLRSLLRRLEVDTLLSVLNRPNLIACMARRLGWRWRLILSERADTLTYFNSIRFGNVMLFLVKRLYNTADLVVTISKGIALSLESLGVKNCLPIHNPIRLPDAEDRAPFREAPSPFTFVVMGRLEPQKNYPLLLRALAAMQTADSHLIVLGKGVLEPELKAQARDLGVADRVTWAGFQKDIAPWLHKADASVLASDYEGFGNVIPEALARALPMVVTDCPHGPREIIAPDTDVAFKIKEGYEEAAFGLLAPVGNVAGLAAAMDRIATDTELRKRYAALGPKRAADFTLPVVAEKYFREF